MPNNHVKLYLLIKTYDEYRSEFQLSAALNLESHSKDDLIEKVTNLFENGPMPILGENKKRDSALGESIENYLGIVNNSSKNADFGDYEIKTAVRYARISLFSTKLAYQNNYDHKSFVTMYGKEHFSKHKQVPTMRLDHRLPYSPTPIKELHVSNNSNGLFLAYNDDVVARMDIDDIEGHFSRKMKNLAFLKLKRHLKDLTFEIENFQIFEGASFDKFIAALKDNLVQVELQFFLIELHIPTLRGHSLRFSVDTFYDLAWTPSTI